MIKALETREGVPRESEHKLLQQARRILHFFNVDTSQWNKAKTIKWILSKLVLFIIVLGLGFYTAKTSLVLTVEYAQSPSSYIGKFMLNQSITLPPSIIWLPLEPFELDDYWAKQDSIPPSEKATHYRKLLFNFFNDTKMTKDYLLSPEYRWPNYLLFVTYFYLYFILQYESLNGKEAIWNMSDLKDSNNDLMTAINIIDYRLKNLKVSTSDLQEKFGAEVKSLFNVTIYYYNSSSELIEVEFDSHFYSIEVGYVSYNMRFDQYSLAEEEYIQIQAQRSDLPNPRPNDYQFKMQVAIGGLSHGQYDYWISYFASSVLVVPLQVTSTYRSLSYRDGELQCSENKPIDLCKSQCRNDYIYQKCGCFATFRNMEVANNNETECYLKNYIFCFEDEKMLNNGEAEENSTRCEDGCLDACERTTYFVPKNSYTYYHLQDSLYMQANYSVFRLVIANFDYPIFEETLKWTFPSFFGTIGGAIGLWLGINVLDSISYAATGVKALIKGRQKKSAKKKTIKSRMNQGEDRGATNETHDNSALSYWKRKERAIKKFYALCSRISKWTALACFSSILIRILLGFLSLMITGLALKEYMSQNITTNVYVEHNETIELPASTICLPLYFGELSYETSVNYAFITHLSNQNITKDSFLPENRQWNNAVRNIVHAYLILVNNCEYGRDCNRAYVGDEDLAKPIYNFEKIMAKLNISIDELRQKFGAEVAALYSFNVAIYNFEERIENVSSNRVNLVDTNNICYELQFNLYPLNVASSFEISVSEYSLPSPRYYNYDRSPASFFFGTRIFTYKLVKESFINSYFGRKSRCLVELTKYHTLRELNGGEVRCMKQTSDECEAVCRIKLIQDRCKCLPTLWPSLLTQFNVVCFLFLTAMLLPNA